MNKIRKGGGRERLYEQLKLKSKCLFFHITYWHYRNVRFYGHVREAILRREEHTRNSVVVAIFCCSRCIRMGKQDGDNSWQACRKACAVTCDSVQMRKLLFSILFYHGQRVIATIVSYCLFSWQEARVSPSLSSTVAP